MSDILIKNMKMPKSCYDCPIHNEEYGCCNIRERVVESAPPTCPLVEVKPHGRLIDADKLTDIIISCIRDSEKEYPKEDFGLVKMVYESCLYHIGKAPTVLEATK